MLTRPLIGAVITAIIAGCALVSGCSSNPISISEATPVPSDRYYYAANDGAAKIVVTRDSGIRASACTVRFTIDGKLAAKMNPGEVATFQLEPGHHVLAIYLKGLICVGFGLVEKGVDLKQNEILRQRVSFSLTDMRLTDTSY